MRVYPQFGENAFLTRSREEREEREDREEREGKSFYGFPRIRLRKFLW